MLIFKKMKLVECTKEEAEAILDICNHSTCTREAADKLFYELAYNYRTNKFPYKTESRSVSTIVLHEMAYNAIFAVINRYKYLKVV